MMTSTPGVIDHAQHTAYSRPGRYANLLDEALLDQALAIGRADSDGETDSVAAVSALARNLIVHYRGSAQILPQESAEDINLRWIEAILDTDQRRHPQPLSTPRRESERVQGCCRDHTLLAVSGLRQLGIPARSRVGFARYIMPPWNHDHVVVEAWIGGRWVRFDPEVDWANPELPEPADIPSGPDAPFLTAAQVWLGHRAGTLDVDRFGVSEGSSLCGAWLVHSYVIHEVAHRFGDELLLWDIWGAMTNDLAEAPRENLELIDDVARLLLAADAADADSGDLAAEQELLALYRKDPRLRPGSVIRSADPNGGFRELALVRP